METKEFKKMVIDLLVELRQDNHFNLELWETMMESLRELSGKWNEQGCIPMSIVPYMMDLVSQLSSGNRFVDEKTVKLLKIFTVSLMKKQAIKVKRGFVPTDEKDFSGEKLEKVRQAGRDLLYLINRGYKIKGASTLVGNLEVALSDSLLIRRIDGTIRDLAGLRGNYRIIDKTERAVNV